MSTIERADPQVADDSIPHDYSKRLMVFGGRSSTGAGRQDRRQARRRPRRRSTLKTFANGEVYCRYEESIRGADVFIVQSTCGNEPTGMTPNDALMELLMMIDAASGASAHRDHRRDALVRLRAPGQEVGAARADHRPPRRRSARGRRRRPRAHDGPPRRPGPGLLPRSRSTT